MTKRLIAIAVLAVATHGCGPKRVRAVEPRSPEAGIVYANIDRFYQQFIESENERELEAWIHFNNLLNRYHELLTIHLQTYDVADPDRIREQLRDTKRELLGIVRQVENVEATSLDRIRKLRKQIEKLPE